MKTIKLIQFQVSMQKMLKSLFQVCLSRIYNSFKGKFQLLFIFYLLSLPGFLRLHRGVFLSHAIKLKITERERSKLSNYIFSVSYLRLTGDANNKSFWYPLPLFAKRFYAIVHLHIKGKTLGIFPYKNNKKRKPCFSFLCLTGGQEGCIKCRTIVCGGFN